MNQHNSNINRNMTDINNDFNPKQLANINQAENQILSQKKEDFNFEKLLMGVLEFKQEAFKSMKVYSDFFKNYLNKNISGNNTKEILKFIEKIEENKIKISENVKIQKEFLSEKNSERTLRLDRLSEFIQNYSEISNTLVRNKRKYKENVLMSNCESSSLNHQLVKTSKNIVYLKEEIIKFDDSILKTKTQSKNLVSQEYELMNKILTSGRELSELNNVTGKNNSDLNVLRSSYAKLQERFDYVKRIKSNICTMNERNKSDLMRKSFHIRKTNENLQIPEQIRILSSGSNALASVQNFSDQESFLFSEIMDCSKLFHGNLRENIIDVQKKYERSEIKYNVDEEKLKKRLLFLFSSISSNYNDIYIESFTQINKDSLAFNAEGVRNVSDQINIKRSICQSELKEYEEGYKAAKMIIKDMNVVIVQEGLEKRNSKLKKNSFILMKCLVRGSRLKKEQQFLAEKEKANEKRVLATNQEYLNQSVINVKNMPDINFNVPPKTKRRRQNSKEKQENVRENKRTEKGPVISKEKILKVDNGNNNYSHNFDVNYKKPVIVFAEPTPIINPIVTQELNNNVNNMKFHHLKTNIFDLEESFNKKSSLDIGSSAFFDNVNKKINDVTINEFPHAKNNAFGGEKKRKMLERF